MKKVVMLFVVAASFIGANAHSCELKNKTKSMLRSSAKHAFVPGKASSVASSKASAPGAVPVGN
ncbi:hypothetical protein K2P97_00690 [bacterium]|nr:hypothetical protein [bacterium]